MIASFFIRNGAASLASRRRAGWRAGAEKCVARSVFEASKKRGSAERGSAARREDLAASATYVYWMDSIALTVMRALE
jgi:hypothetical protein